MDVTAGCVKCNYCRKVQLFFSLKKAFYFKACTDAGPVDALKVQSLNSNTKISRVQVHLLSEGPTCSLNLSVDVLSFLRISKQ